MTFEINKIYPSMSHEDKVYEYARRISHYSLLASSERALSKVFNCSNLDRNFELFGERCGCFKHGANDAHKPCKACTESHLHYLNFREAKAKRATALRQLNKEMTKCK